MELCSSSEDEYADIDEDVLSIQCLFCDSQFNSHDFALKHIQQDHGIDIIQKCKTQNFTTYDFLKLVNYIRQNKVCATEIDTVLQSKDFDNEQYLKPFLEDDHFLMFDFDDEIEDEVCLHGDALVSNEDLEKLSKDQLLENYYNLKTQHETSVKVVNELREFIKKNIIDDIDDISAINQKSKVSTLNDQTDSGYISSYSHFSIHHSMLSDKPRTLAYKNAILQNESFFKGKSVLDIGCGTGILSLFAAKAGAEIVVAIDHSDIIYQAMDIVFKNGYQNVIKTVKGKLEQIDFKKLELPTKYDIILSEWMGYFLLFEGMVDTVIHARDNLMATNGILLPNRCELFLAAFSDKNFYTNNISFWNDVYGFDMSSIIKDVTKEATIDVASNQSICSSIEKIYEMNVTNCSLENVQTVVSAFDFRFEKETEVHGIVGWFDCHFDSMNKPFTLSTSPTSESTHWKQTIFPFDQAISVKSNENLKGEIQISRDPSDVRALKIEIKLKDSKFVYNLC